MKPNADAVAARAVAAVDEGISYQQMDCQAFVERVVTACGGAMAFAGSNDMARHACDWVEPIEDARKAGRLVPGVALFIKEPDESGLPEKYRGDGLGDFSHVGLYVGSKSGLRDVDKNGRMRACDVVHSSATMKRVAGSTLQNGWTHVGRLSAVEYGDGATGVAATSATVVAGAAVESSSDGLSTQPLESAAVATICTPNGLPLKMRAKPTANCKLYKKLPNGAQVLVVERNCGDDCGWARVQVGSRRWYVRAEFIRQG